jgi:hypothetical protein
LFFVSGFEAGAGVFRGVANKLDSLDDTVVLGEALDTGAFFWVTDSFTGMSEMVAVFAFGTAGAEVGFFVTEGSRGVSAVVFQSALHTFVVITTGLILGARALFFGAAGDTHLIHTEGRIAIAGVTRVARSAAAPGVAIAIAAAVSAAGVIMPAASSTATI